MVRSIIQYGKLNDNQKLEVVDIFIESFKRFIMVTKDRNILSALFLDALNPVYTYALVENETVIGILGLGTNKIRPIKCELGACIDLFGQLRGRVVYLWMKAIFQRQMVKSDRDLYIDVLATAKQARGRGIATRLLEHSFNLQGYHNYYIDVMSKNIDAKRLYEQIGFVEYKKKRVSVLLFSGAGYPIRLKKR